MKHTPSTAQYTKHAHSASIRWQCKECNQHPFCRPSAQTGFCRSFKRESNQNSSHTSISESPTVTEHLVHHTGRCRYYEDDKHVARKMEVLVDMQHNLNLEHLRARGPQPDERMQPETSAPPPPAAATTPEADAEIVGTLAAIMPGYSQHAFQRAALAVGNSDTNAAMNWLLAHSEDADLNDPIQAPSGAPAAAGEVDSQAVAELKGMGFTERQAAAALKVCKGDSQRAVLWIFDQGPSLDEEVDKIEAASQAAAAQAAEPQVGTTYMCLVTSAAVL